MSLKNYAHQLVDDLTSEKTVQERYLEKDFIGSSHWWVKNTLKNLRSNSRVLDIGPGSGYIEKFLRTKSQIHITGVEIDAETRNILAKSYDSMLENLDSYSGPKFDYVFMLDVLEHMSEPESFLKDLMQHLNKNASIFISLPNVAHWSVRLPLLFGYFEYTNRGLLDRTHLQLFNRRRVIKMIKAISSLEIKEISSSIEPVEFILPKYLTQNLIFQVISKLRLLIAKKLPGFFAYQHLIHLEYRA